MWLLEKIKLFQFTIKNLLNFNDIITFYKLLNYISLITIQLSFYIQSKTLF